MMIKNLNMINKNKILRVIVMFAIIVLYILNGVYVNAEEISNEVEESTQINEIIDIDVKEDLYKFSEEKNIYLPFIRISYDKVEVDSEVSNIGIVYGNKGIDVNSKTQNIQILISNDTVRVNNSMEYAVVVSNGNVIIDSNIDKTLVIFAGEKVTLTENANVNGDVICFSNSLEIKGNVSGSVVGSVVNAIVSGKVNKDFRVSAQNINISENNISGNLFIETNNNNIEIELKEKYPDAQIKFISQESTTNSLINILVGAIKTALVYTLAYLIVTKISKNNIFKNLLDVTSKNSGFTIVSGSLLILSIPLGIMIAFLGIFIGIEEIIVPILILYIALIITISMLSIFICGSLIHEYIIEKYFEDLELIKRLVCAFFVFLSMILLTNIPKVGIYINMVIIIVSIGIMASYAFKREVKIKGKKRK